MNNVELEYSKQQSFDLADECLYMCPDGCANMDVDDCCMKCIEGSYFVRK